MSELIFGPDNNVILIYYDTGNCFPVKSISYLESLIDWLIDFISQKFTYTFIIIEWITGGHKPIKLN